MVIFEVIYNKGVRVRERQKNPDEYVLLGWYCNGNPRRMHVLTNHAVSIEEVKEKYGYFDVEEHARLDGEEINQLGGIRGKRWGSFHHEYEWRADPPIILH